MCKIVKIGLIGSFILSGVVFGADFSKKTNDELVQLSGIVEPNDVLDYNKEIERRINEMTRKEAKEFRDKIREQEDKVYDNMKIKDLELRKKSIFDAMKKQCKDDPKSCPKPHHDMGHKPGKPDGKDAHREQKPSPKP